MCQQKKDGQREDCPGAAMPIEKEILQVLRSLSPDRRREALDLLRDLQEKAKGGGDHGAP